MRCFLAGFLVIFCVFTVALAGAPPTRKTTKKTAKKTTAKHSAKSQANQSGKAAGRLRAVGKTGTASVRRIPVPAVTRAAARAEIDRKMAGVEIGVENPAALDGYFAALDRASQQPVHILQFGDSHTASDDWVNAMRVAAQALYGDGGPGYIHAGHPYLGYRRFDASGSNSAGWKTDGNKSRQSDVNQGLSHISISTNTPGQTVHLAASGESLGIFFLRQPEGGQFELTVDGDMVAVVSTALPADSLTDTPAPGYFSKALSPGRHEITLRTMNFAPVRLFGWTLDNPKGVTFETLGINGAWANRILDANESLWASELSQRAPSLVILAFGTNEANSHIWNEAQYRSDLTEIVARIRRATPAASILLVGPPDCGKLRPLLHLTEVIDVQREMAGSLGVAFWDWRLHMGGARAVSQWVTAGLSQGDYVHLTGEGYRLIGNMLFAQLEKAHTEHRHD